MAKKDLNPDRVVNELRGQSVFFQSPHSPISKRDAIAKAKPAERKSVRKTERTEKRSVRLPKKRATKRYSFEFYVDQLKRLKKLEIEAGLRGEGFNKSAVVREALDGYFEALSSDRSENRTNERTEFRTEKRRT